MSFDNDVNIDNSFNITLENPTQNVQRVAMFELGSDDPDILSTTNTPIVQQPNNIHNSWTMAVGGGSYPHPLRLLTTTNPPKLAIHYDNQFVWTIKGALYGMTFTAGIRLDVASEEINTAMISNPLTKYVRIELTGVLDPDTKEPTIDFLRVNITYLTKDPNTGDTTGFFTGDPNDPTNDQLITQYGMIGFTFSSGIPDFYQNQINFQKASITQFANNGAVVVVVGQGTPYAQILASQNGQVLDIKTMRVDALASLGNPAVPFYQDKQLLAPLEFTKLEANDNKIVYRKIPTIDPYQFQKCVDFIDMKTKADTFALDGTTKFNMDIQPYTTMRLSCNYTSITNLVADTEYSAEMVAKEKEAIAQQKEAGDNSRTYKLEVPDDIVKGIEKQNIIYNNQLDELEKKKTHYYTKRIYGLGWLSNFSYDINQQIKIK